MKTVQWIWLLALVAFLPAPTLDGGLAATKQAGLRFEARPSRPVFGNREPVSLIFTLRNDTDEEITVPYKLARYYDIDLDIKGPDGKSAAWCGVIPSIIWEMRRVRILKPKSEVRAQVTISCSISEPLNCRWGYDLSRVGQYTVTGRYEPAIPACSTSLAEAHVKPRYCGPLRAEPLTFVIADGPNRAGPKR